MSSRNTRQWIVVRWSLVPPISKAISTLINILRKKKLLFIGILASILMIVNIDAESKACFKRDLFSLTVGKRVFREGSPSLALPARHPLHAGAARRFP